MAESAFESPASPGFSVVKGAMPPALLIVEAEAATWKPSPREARLLAALAAAGLKLAYARPAPGPELAGEGTGDEAAHWMGGARQCNASGSAGTDGPADAHAAPAQLLLHQIALCDRLSPEMQLVTLCRKLGIQPMQAILIARTPRSLPIALKVGTLLALEGAGYKNEAAADRVFRHPSEGGLEKALEYAVRMYAAERASMRAPTRASG